MKVHVVRKVIPKLKGLLSAKEATISTHMAMIISTTTEKIIFTYKIIWLMTYITKHLNIKQSNLWTPLLALEKKQSTE